MPFMSLDPLDLYDRRSLLSEEERLVQDNVARFVDREVLPIIGECFAAQRFPNELVPRLAELGLFGATLAEHGCAGLNYVSYGLICEELERGDSSLRSFVSVQSSLVMGCLDAFGSDDPFGYAVIHAPAVGPVTVTLMMTPVAFAGTGPPPMPASWMPMSAPEPSGTVRLGLSA